jgi:hypothetical protein
MCWIFVGGNREGACGAVCLSPCIYLAYTHARMRVVRLLRIIVDMRDGRATAAHRLLATRE